MPEVLPAGGCLGGDDGYILDDGIECKIRVCGPVAFAFAPNVLGVFSYQSFEGILALLFEGTKRKVAVDLVEVELQAKDRMEADGYVDQYVDVVCKALAGACL